MQHLPKEDLQSVITPMQSLLASLHVHYNNLRHAHWNVTGPHFTELHAHFEELYSDTEAFIDEVAERLRALGIYISAKMADHAEASVVKEFVVAPASPQEMLEAILAGNEILAMKMRETIKAAEKLEDFGTADLLATRLAGSEKQSWMLRALLNKA